MNGFTYEEDNAFIRIKKRITNNVLAKMSIQPENVSDIISVNVKDSDWGYAEDKFLVIKQISSWLSEEHLSGKWIDKNLIRIKW